MSTTTENLTVYGFPVEKVWRESYLPVEHYGGIRFYTITLEGLEVNRKVYDQVTVEYVRKHGQAYVSVGDLWRDVTDSARDKICKAADAHMRATDAVRFADPEDARGAVRQLVADAAREEFSSDKRRGSLSYVRSLGRPGDHERWGNVAGARLTEEEAHEVYRTAYAAALGEHIGELQDTLEALER